MHAKLEEPLGSNINGTTLGETENRPNTKRIRFCEMSKITSPSLQDTNTEYSRPKRLCSVKSSPVLTQITQNSDKKNLIESLNIIEPQSKTTNNRVNRISPTKQTRLNKNPSFNDLNNKNNKNVKSTIQSSRNSFTCLRNLGSTCYINCIIQVMRYTPGFVLSINRLNKQIEYLKSLKNPEIDTEINRNNDIAFVKNLHELLVDMSKIEQSDRRPICTPRKFVSTVWSLLSFWSDGSQQDAHEFLQYTIHFINECDLSIRKIQQQFQLKQDTKDSNQTISLPVIEAPKIKRVGRKPSKPRDVEIFPAQNPLLLISDESSSSSTSSSCSSSASSTSAVSAPAYELKSKLNPLNISDTNFLRTPTKGGASSYNLNLLESNLNSKKDTEEELIFRPMIKSDPGVKQENLKIKIQVDKVNDKYKIMSPPNKKSILLDDNDLVSKRLKETLNSSFTFTNFKNDDRKQCQANSLNDSDSVIIMDSDGDDEVYFMDDNEVLHPIEKKMPQTPESFELKNCFVLLEKIKVENFKTEPKHEVQETKNIKKFRTKSKTFPNEIEKNIQPIFDLDAITSVSTVRSYSSSKNDSASLRKLRSNPVHSFKPVVPSTPPSPAQLLRKYSAGHGYTCEMDKLFKGSSVTVTQCLECENLRKCPESFYDRSIPLETTDNEDESSCWIAKCLSNESYLNENSKYMCDQCVSKQEAKIQTMYTQMPSILILHLLSYGITSSDDGNLNTRKLSNRLRLVNYFDFQCKRDDNLLCENSVPMSIRNKPESIKYQFKLFAVVMHSGVSLNSGHYTAFVNYKIVCQNNQSFDNSVNLKPNLFDENDRTSASENTESSNDSSNTEWLHFDDTKVKSLSNNEFQRKILDSNYDSPYILFYVRE